jgi:NTP pyrophosphatase (non-canonical NTP hydrolase)
MRRQEGRSSMSDEQTTIAELKQLVEQFVRERDWQQFHTPKNLAMALAIEAAELMEHFQWLEPGESRAVADDARKGAVGEELADVVCYALAMANELGIDVAEALRAKMVKNAEKYPASEFRGRWGEADERPKR